MKNREAIQILEEESEFLKHQGEQEFPEAMDVAIKVLEQADKYRWHKVKANEIPEGGKVLLLTVRNEKLSKSDYTCGIYIETTQVTEDGSKYKTGFFNFNGMFDGWKVVAWRYIEPFDVPDTNVGEIGGVE